jgi:hypothetical protein
MLYAPEWEQQEKEFEQVMRNEISNIAVLALEVSCENKHVRSSRQIQGLWRVLSVLFDVQKDPVCFIFSLPNSAYSDKGLIYTIHHFPVTLNC